LLSKKQSFLALDIGTDKVRAFGFAKNDKDVKTHLWTETGKEPMQNIINAIDAIEDKLSVHFRRAFITGNFGIVESILGKNSLSWPRPHKITEADVYNSICYSRDLENISKHILHLIPLQFVIDGEYDVKNAAGMTGRTLSARFNCLAYPNDIIDEIKRGLASASIPPNGFYDPIYLLGQTYQKGHSPAIFIDFGETVTKVGVKTERGLVSRFDIGIGQGDITKRLCDDFGIDFADAENMKLSALNSAPSQSDAYVLANEKYSATISDVWDTWTEINSEIIDEIIGRTKTYDAGLFITGAGENPNNIKRLILENKGLENIAVLDEYAAVGAFGKIFQADIKITKTPMIKIHPIRNVPIIPSIMCWNISNDYIYKMFRGIGIKRIHIDVMDGFYTDKVMGGIDDIKKIRTKTNLRLHVHLMVDDPLMWCGDVIKAGADIIIISSGARNIAKSLKEITSAGKQCGLALHPDFNMRQLNKEILTMANEIMVMGVKPGASGQKFMPEALRKIRILYNTRKKYGFRYKISVDGGIDDKTAADCWKAGADFLISGSFLRNATDFDNAVLSLLPKNN
jgi:ribulose-phosphate 3-epimerase